MEIVVNHLTRMAAPRICVAGLNVETRSHVRPVVIGGRLDASMLAENGGLFALGAQIALANPSPRPSPPEVEDVAFSVESSEWLARLSGPDFWGVLAEVSRPALGSIFGGALERDGNTASLPEGVGDASLGVLRPAGRLSMVVSFGKPRLELYDADLGQLSVPITDLRLFHADSGELRPDRFNLMADRLRRRDCLLSVGVGHVWAREAGEPRHWLQINNVHLDDNPLWPD